MPCLSLLTSDITCVFSHRPDDSNNLLNAVKFINDRWNGVLVIAIVPDDVFNILRRAVGKDSACYLYPLEYFLSD